MPTKHPRTTEETEKLIALAMEDYQKGNISYEAAAAQRGIPKNTLWNRMHGRQERHKAHEKQQALNNDVERELVGWCHLMERRSLPVRLIHLVGRAEAVWNNQNGTEGEKLGEHWVRGFLARHPELKLTTSKRIHESRVMARNPENILEYYDMLNETRQEFKVPLRRVFNMDEKGYLLGISSQEKVVILTRDHRDGYAGGSKHSGNRETITTADTICAKGYVLPPMIIMKGKNIQRSWMEDSPLPEDTLWACSPTGWTNNELGRKYIEWFDKQTAHESPNGEHRLLILDGHGSHLTYEFLDYAEKAHIIVLGLPSHTTDFLQPLDRVIFRSLQRSYGQAVGEYARKNLRVTKRSFAKLLHQAREATYTKDKILSAFEATGIEPFNPYRTPIMKEYEENMAREKATADSTPSSSHLAPPLTPRSRRLAVSASARDVLEDPEASVESLRQALEGTLGLVDGSEARAFLAETRVKEWIEEEKEQRKQKKKGGKVGHSQVYTQKEALEVLRE